MHPFHATGHFIPPKNNRNPIDTGRKLNVHMTFRRRPGRLLNVLYTFNLRFVSTGKPLVFYVLRGDRKRPVA